MKYDLSQHPYFTAWRDPESNVTSYILTERVAPVQENFYFTFECMSADGELLWFQATHPPGGGRSLAVVGLNPEAPFIRHWPNAGAGQGALTPDGRGCYVCLDNEIWLWRVDEEPQRVSVLDAKWINHRAFSGLRGITLSADHRLLLVHGKIGVHWFVGVGDLETGEVTILKEFGAHHNHTQFHPAIPNLFLIAEDWWHDPVSGQHFPYDHRTWIMDVEQPLYQPVTPKLWVGHGFRPSHEWWSGDGWLCWNDYATGCFEWHLEAQEIIQTWEGPKCHAHCSNDRQLWVADESPYKWKDKPCQILFYDRRNDKQYTIASAMPYPKIRRKYQVDTDPHPRFGPDDSCISYTTSVLGDTDLAITRVEDILE